MIGPAFPPMTQAEAIKTLMQIRNLPEYHGPTPDDYYGAPLSDEEDDDSD